MKKKIALLLAGVMALSTLPMSVFAADTTTSVRVPGVLNANSNRSKTLFTSDDMPGLTVLSTSYNNTSVSDNTGSDIYTADGRTTSGAGVTTAPIITSDDQEDLNTVGTAVNNAGYDVASAPVVTVSGLTASEGAKFDLILTNGASSAVWGDKFNSTKTFGETNYSKFDAYLTNAINIASPGVSVKAVRNPNVNNKVTIEVLYAVTEAVVKVPVIASAGTNSENLMVSVKALDNNSNVVSATSTVATVSNDTTGGNTTTKISEQFSGKNSLMFDVLTSENVAGTFGKGYYETKGNKTEKVTYTVNSNFTFAGFGSDTSSSTTTLSEDTWTDVTAYATTDNGVGVTVLAKVGTASNKMDVKYVFDNSTPTKNASTVKLTGVTIKPKASASLGQEVTMTVTPDSNSEFTKQDGIVVGYYSDYDFTAKLFENKEVPALESGRMEFVPADKNGIVYDDEDVFADDTTSIARTDYFEDFHATAALRVSENVAKSFIDGRTVKFTLPEGVNVAGFEITNYNYISTGLVTDVIYEYTDTTNADFVIDANTVSIKNLVRDNGADLASFNIVFYVVADANYTGDVDVAVTGDALGGAELDAVKVASFAPAFKVSTDLTTVKSGVQSTATKDIVISETENGRFEDGETVYVSLDTASTAVLLNALVIEDGDVSVTAGDLEVEKVTINDNYLSFKVANASSTDKPSEITVSNVKVSTAYGLPETTSYPFNVQVYTDGLANGEGRISGDLDGASIRFGKLAAPYINIKNSTGTGAANGSVVKVQAGSTTYTIDGVEATMDAAPFIDSKTSSMMVPVRFIADGVGITEESGNLIWSANNKTVIIRNGSDIIEFPVGSTFYRVNGATIYNDNSAVTQIVDGRTFVPFRTMGNALSIPVSWDEATRTAQYN